MGSAAPQVVEAEVARRRRSSATSPTTITCSRSVQPVADGGQVGQVVALADARHDDEGPGPALAQDEADLLGPVEVDDRHQGDAEHGAGVEGDGRLDPVGQLEGDHVARARARGRAGRRPRAAPPRRPRRPCRGRVGRRPDAEAPARVLEEAVAQELPERAVVPGALGPVALGQLGRHRAQLEAGRRHADSMNERQASRWRCGAGAARRRTSFCFTRLKRKWASLAQVKPTPPCSWMSSPVTRTPASAA